MAMRCATLPLVERIANAVTKAALHDRKIEEINPNKLSNVEDAMDLNWNEAREIGELLFEKYDTLKL